MYNLLVKSGGWEDSRDQIDVSRVFEYTENYLKEKFSISGNIDLDKMRALDFP